MGFSYQQQHFTPDELNPMRNMVSDFLKQAKGMNELKYQPRQMEADIFSKEISPLAALASSPQFKGFSPAIQHQIAQRIGGYLQGGGQGMQGAQGNQGQIDTGPSPAYPTGNDILSRLLKHSQEVYQPGGAKKLAGSNLAAAAEQWGFPGVAKALGGRGTNAANAALQQDINDAIQFQVMNGVPEAIARQRFARGPNESDEDYAKKVSPYLQSEEAKVTKAVKESNASLKTEFNEKDDFDLAQKLSVSLNNKYHKDIPLNIIYDYLQKNKGPINIAEILKLQQVQ